MKFYVQVGLGFHIAGLGQFFDLVDILIEPVEIGGGSVGGGDLDNRGLDRQA